MATAGPAQSDQWSRRGQQIGMEFLSLLLLWCLCVLGAPGGIEGHPYGYVVYDGDIDQEDAFTTDSQEAIPMYAVARATYHNVINSTGWAYLELATSDSYSDDRQAFGAGYLEGFVTHRLIWLSYRNTLDGFCNEKTSVCEKIDDYLAKNYWFVQDSIQKLNGTDPYWHQVNLAYLQMKGIHQGYNRAAAPSQQLTFDQVLWLNLNGDLEDLATALGVEEQHGGKKQPRSRKAEGDGRCSALIKLLGDYSDILVGHTTWTKYSSMIRIQKHYDLGYKLAKDASAYIPGRSVSMSSYPGVIHSLDDFNVISSGLVTLETTISNDNPDLWTNISPNGQVLEFLRSVVANRLAKSGKEWSSIFGKYNSGTYNNQWLVLDYKRFDPNGRSPAKPGLFWLLEQMPGFVKSADLTNVLYNQSYFASYNTPFFEDVFKMSGQPAMVAKYGDWFTYERTPRALIFKREQGGISSVDGMMSVMRYNDFRHDPLSSCNCTPPYSAENAIGARNDLNLANGTYPFRALGHRSHGAIDAKVTNSSLARNLMFNAVSSPPFNIERGLAPFQWSTSDFASGTPHFGHPDRWNFVPQTYQWEQQ